MALLSIEVPVKTVQSETSVIGTLFLERRVAIEFSKCRFFFFSALCSTNQIPLTSIVLGMEADIENPGT